MNETQTTQTPEVAAPVVELQDGEMKVLPPIEVKSETVDSNESAQSPSPKLPTPVIISFTTPSKQTSKVPKSLSEKIAVSDQSHQPDSTSNGTAQPPSPNTNSSSEKSQFDLTDQTPESKQGSQVLETVQINLESEPIKAEPPTIKSAPVKVESEPVKVEAEPVKLESKLVTVKAELEKVEFRPVQIKSEPVKVESDPAEVESEPVSVKPELVKVESDRLKNIADPATIKPEPVNVKIEPVKFESKPVPINVVPVKVDSKPVKNNAEPKTIKPEPVKINAEPVTVGVKPLTVKVESEPVKTQIETETVKVDLVKVESEPVKLKTESIVIKTKPETLKTEPGTLKTEPGTLKTEPGTLKTEPEALESEPAKKVLKLTKIETDLVEPVKTESQQIKIEKTEAADVKPVESDSKPVDPFPCNGSDASDDDKENENASCDLKTSQAAMARCNVDEMLRRMDEIDPSHKLRSLCKKGDAANLEEFLRDEVDMDVQSDEGWTCLHEIITHECQFTDVARILLSHGAKVNTQDLHGDSPLHSCLLYHCTENISLLLNHGADLELTNGSGRKPIHVANDEESLRLLLEHGANANAVDQMGNTCLHYAVVAKDKDRVKLLLTPKYKTDISVQNGTGSTPLHLANDPEIAALLLEASADPNIIDLAGNSPLHLAVRGRHKEVVRNLMEKKADPNIVNSSGKLPTSLAKDKEMKNILTGKFVPPAISGNGSASAAAICGSSSASGNVTPTLLQSRKRPYSPSTSVTETPTSVPLFKDSPGSILKRKRRDSSSICERTSRLRFSDVNEYSLMDPEHDSLNRRVKVRPIYSEPQFSSDED